MMRVKCLAGCSPVSVCSGNVHCWISVARVLVSIMEAQCHEIDDFCDIVPNKQVFCSWHGQAAGVHQHCVMCVLVSKLCAKKPLLGLLMGAGWGVKL